MATVDNATGQKVFGTGYFWGATNATVTPTPVSFLALQSMSLDFKRDIKYLHGVNQLPIAVASGKLTVSGKAELAALNGRLVADLLLGTSLTSGQQLWIKGEAGTVPGTPFHITVANSGTWFDDMGVVYADGASAFNPLVRVASAPAVGQYSVASGVYTFNATDTTRNMLLSYEYTASTSGQYTTMTNQPMGATGSFSAVMAMFFGSEKASVQLNNVTSGGLSFATKLDDFMMTSFDFGCATDSTDTLGIFSFAEVN